MKPKIGSLKTSTKLTNLQLGTDQKKDKLQAYLVLLSFAVTVVF